MINDSVLLCSSHRSAATHWLTVISHIMWNKAAVLRTSPELHQTCPHILTGLEVRVQRKQRNCRAERTRLSSEHMDSDRKWSSSCWRLSLRSHFVASSDLESAHTQSENSCLITHTFSHKHWLLHCSLHSLSSDWQLQASGQWGHLDVTLWLTVSSTQQHISSGQDQDLRETELIIDHQYLTRQRPDGAAWFLSLISSLVGDAGRRMSLSSGHALILVAVLLLVCPHSTGVYSLWDCSGQTLCWFRSSSTSCSWNVSWYTLK